MDTDSFLQSFIGDVAFFPITMGPIIALVITGFLLFASGFISASEIAFFSLEPGDFDQLNEGQQPSDSVIKRLLQRSQSLLASILIANNFVNVAVVMLCTYVFNALVDFSSAPVIGFVVQTVLLTFLLLLFGEVIPKIYAQTNALKFSRFSAPTLDIIERSLKPFSKLLIKSSHLFNKRLSKKKYDLSMDELSKALELTSGEIEEGKEMLEEIIKFYNKTAVEIMTSRLDMEDLDIKCNFQQVIDFVIESGYSRIPIYAETEDNIKGILYIKDLLPYLDKSTTFRWQSLIRSAYFVPETKKIDDLLEEFRTSKIHMAIVVDEFGGTSGIVTMEDILEEIVGDISDEYDDDSRQYVELADGTYVFEGKILLADFFRVTGVDNSDFGKLLDEVDTLAGLVLELKGDFPLPKEVISFMKYRFQVLEMDKRRILKIKYYEEETGDTRISD